MKHLLIMLSILSIVMASEAAPKKRPRFLGTNEVVSGICRKLTACHSNLKWDACKTGVFSRNDIDTEVGFMKDAFATYNDAVKAELARKVRFFVFEFNGCLENLNALSCSDPIVMRAYQAQQPDALANVTALFSPICADMFYYEAR